ncbi:MAG: hypothetical protein ACTHOF_12515 [Flavisolibacter sp.]
MEWFPLVGVFLQGQYPWRMHGSIVSPMAGGRAPVKEMIKKRVGPN